MPFYDEDRHREYREGLSPRFGLGAVVVLPALLIGMSVVVMLRQWVW